MSPTHFTELTRARLLAWLSDSEIASAGAGALRRSGHGPSALAETLHAVTEAPASAARLASLVEHAKRKAGLPAANTAIERWLLAHTAVTMLSAARQPLLGQATLERIVRDCSMTRGQAGRRCASPASAFASSRRWRLAGGSAPGSFTGISAA